MTQPWWHPDRHADRREVLHARARIKSGLRSWFDASGFIEVDPGCLQVSPGNEAHLHAFSTSLMAPDLGNRRLYLHTSPEFAMKKLLAAGEDLIFAITPCFRNRERGPLHAPEFTMIEWYRADAAYEEVMADAARLLNVATGVTGAKLVSWRGRTCDPAAEPERLTVAQAFLRYAGIDLTATLAPAGLPDRDALAQALAARGVSARAHDSWSDLFSRAIAVLIEPHLGIGRPTVLYGYPAAGSALARPIASDPRFAERSELYVCGVELANGFGELTDRVRQRANLAQQMDEKERVYGERYPLDEDFLAALDLMPEASGCALGFDRLVMLATGATHIDQVLWTPLSF